MGLFDALGRANDQFKEGADAVLDNETFSLQDSTRGALAGLTGKSEQEFAEDATQDYENVKDAVTNPIGDATKAAGLHTDATVGAARGAEAAFDLFVGDPIEYAYGSATGVNTTTTNPEMATTEWNPGVLEALEGAIVLGPASKAASLGAKGAKAASAASKGDDMFGGITKVADDVLGLGRKADDVPPRTTQNADLATQNKMNEAFRPRPSKKPEATKTPDFLSDTAARVSVGDAVPKPSEWSKTKQALYGALGGGALGLGAAGVIGGPNVYPDGYTVDRTYSNPDADRVKQFDADNKTQGYWVAVNEKGGTVVSLDGNGGYTEVTFPSNRDPPFDSAGQADAAYQTWKQQQENQGQQTPTYSDDAQNPEYTWGEADIRLKLDYGWYLARQEHNTKDRYRFFIVGVDPNGELLYIGPNAAADYTAPPHPTEEEAMNAYNVWVSNAQNGNYQHRPDPGQDRPTPADIVNDARSNNRDTANSGLGSVATIAAGAAGLGVLAFIFMVIL